MLGGIEFQAKNMKSESFPNIIHSFMVVKKCCLMMTIVQTLKL